MGCHTWFLNGLTKSKLEELRSEIFIGYRIQKPFLLQTQFQNTEPVLSGDLKCYLKSNDNYKNKAIVDSILCVCCALLADNVFSVGKKTPSRR